MLLYEHPLSSHAQKVEIALREKGVKFDLETPTALGSGNSTGPFAAASPRLEVPTRQRKARAMRPIAWHRAAFRSCATVSPRTTSASPGPRG
jgi:glutathione S-transferase